MLWGSVAHFISTSSNTYRALKWKRAPLWLRNLLIKLLKNKRKQRNYSRLWLASILVVNLKVVHTCVNLQLLHSWWIAGAGTASLLLGFYKACSAMLGLTLKKWSRSYSTRYLLCRTTEDLQFHLWSCMWLYAAKMGRAGANFREGQAMILALHELSLDLHALFSLSALQLIPSLLI